MEYNFKGKTVLVTGAGQGIGKSVCLKLAQYGAHVKALSRTKSHLEELQKENPSIEVINVDLNSWASTRQALASVGKIDGLVNNAGISLLNSFFDISEEDIDRSFDVNVKAVINVSQLVAKGMVDRRQGSIVNVSSQASKVGIENHTVYCGTKAALDNITRCMALELGKHNVRTNCVNPTVVLTAMGKRAWSDPKKSGPIKSKIPLNRFAEIKEVVDVILFLLSDNASMVNGVTIPIDGGLLAVC